MLALDTWKRFSRIFWDLSPLAHMSLVLLGLGKAYFNGELLDGKTAMEKAGINIIQELSSKEGLALTNGTQCF